MKPPTLFDRATLEMRRQRIHQDALFLHKEASAMIHERIEEVNRSFSAPAFIGPFGKAWAKQMNMGAAVFADDKDVLDLQEAAHDLIVHAMCLHWANDPVGQLVQMRRALKPDGMMIAVFFGGQTLSELRVAFAETESKILGGISPRIAPLGDIRDLGSLLQRAGFALPVADSFKFNTTYSNILTLAQDLRGMGDSNIMTDRLRKPITRSFLNALENTYHAHFSTDGRLRVTFDLMFLTGWAPSIDQQKPLQPGSAKTRLADALGVKEKNPEND